MPENPVDFDLPRSVDLGRVTPLSPAPAVTGATAQPLTRRELRQRERDVASSASVVFAAAASAATPASSTPAPGAPAVDHMPTRRMPPLVTCESALLAAPRVRKRAWLAKGFSLLAMLFVAGMAIATSVPAKALVSHDEVVAQAQAATTGNAAKVPAQSITSSSDVQTEALVRDVYTVKSLDQLVVLSHMRIADTFTNDPNGTIQWPFPVGVPITDWFGPRIAPTDGASTFHEGIDFTPGAGTPIQIIADGVVRKVVTNPGDACGVNVTIDHMINGKLVSSMYCHMQAGSVRVVEGQHVKVADIVGLVGNTGISTGAHLHFQIMPGGTTPVDPYAWLKANAN